jgi:hypothetical protein
MLDELLYLCILLDLIKFACYRVYVIYIYHYILISHGMSL